MAEPADHAALDGPLHRRRYPAAMDMQAFKDRFLDQNNPSATRFYGMGFKLGRVDIGNDYGCIRVRAEFICVCGQREAFSVSMSAEMARDPWAPSFMLNFYEALDKNGSMSRKHLLEDGYTPEEVDDMERRLEEYKRGQHVNFMGLSSSSSSRRIPGPLLTTPGMTPT
jgi:hypothetical protein